MFNNVIFIIMAWEKQFITKEDGTNVSAMAPMIISASRSTDIPAFYSDWFFNRLKIGYSAWVNPFNKEKYYISYNNCKFIVFWSKNPAPLLDHIDELKERGIDFYIQFTLNDYFDDGLEPNLPLLCDRIYTFKKLSLALGKEHVIWRFDPLILTDTIDVEKLLNKIRNIGVQLMGMTEKLVFSFADISVYNKVKTNLTNDGVKYREWTEEEMLQFAEGLAEMNKAWGYKLATCGEKVDLSQFGVEHNRCVDDELITRIAYKNKELMKFLGIEIKCVDDFLFGTEDMPKDAIVINNEYYGVRTKNNKDTGQRALCGCIISKDIGQYNTCVHGCKYCYANADTLTAQKNYAKYAESSKSEETIV